MQNSSSTTSASTATTGGSRGSESDPQQPESAMQQLLTNISAATGSSELLGFGVGGSTSGGTQRTRTPHGGTQAQAIDDGLESTTIPNTFSRWEEESAAIDGHMPHLVMRVLREDILKHWIEEYEKENAPKDDQNKTTTASTTSATTTTTTTTTTGESSSSSSARAMDVGQSSQGESSGTSGTSVARQGEATPNVVTVPHPSDEATPSSHSPRDQTSVVDQLRSGLRQVADALAQTVAAVRSTREQILQGRESVAGVGGGGADGDDGGEEVSTASLREEEGSTSRGEEMESQNASVAEATGEELTTPMEESSVYEATNLVPPSTQQEQQPPLSHSPAPSPG